MYALAIVLILAALGGVYTTLHGDDSTSLPPQQVAQALAENLAVYRQATLDYARQHPGTNRAVSNAQLTPLFPAWYRTANPLWRNYVADRTVVTYAAARPPVNIVGEIETLAQGSLFAGQAYRGAVVHSGFTNGTLPANGVPLPAGVTIADGLPVWMGQAY
ncbi:type IV pilus biogenesis protein PilM [Burkholderia sp. FERM BP-3421]|uniref:type IV pilus biogenesis protein PilM n=1 Tax=Burkholderia sp. FERM BP-3421 TaxID=1494466 RepID=UPI002361CB26|nr:type IV pilus biogenesis protein PilM [Burkholderia sp. FERM BP-3421]WDD92555.1 type IV pilus biogenesis protein PilM [Burkholderia sp. FERM BP-3421]